MLHGQLISTVLPVPLVLLALLALQALLDLPPQLQDRLALLALLAPQALPVRLQRWLALQVQLEQTERMALLAQRVLLQ